LLVARETSSGTTRGRGGRPRDPAREASILDAAIEVLTEEGFDALTIEAVAARAGAGKSTLYRRWPSKVELVLDAVARVGSAEVALDALPDTGSLREDVVALIRPQSLAQDELRLRVMGGLQSLAAREPGLAQAAFAASTGPWVEANRLLIRRSIERGEYAGGDVETLAQVIPMMCSCRTSVQQQPITREFLVSLVDGVLVPALRGSAPPPA
jgi:AcrR family transcriptional regulator